jgi:hypothetical protein
MERENLDVSIVVVQKYANIKKSKVVAENVKVVLFVNMIDNDRDAKNVVAMDSAYTTDVNHVVKNVEAHQFVSIIKLKHSV